jgi:hypothetical protein
LPRLLDDEETGKEEKKGEEDDEDGERDEADESGEVDTAEEHVLVDEEPVAENDDEDEDEDGEALPPRFLCSRNRAGTTPLLATKCMAHAASRAWGAIVRRSVLLVST